MIKVAIVGASGYTGGELLRILSTHPEVEVVAITSERSAGNPVEQVFPHLKQFFNLSFESLDVKRLSEKAEFIFTALPHGTSMEPVGEFVESGKKVVDLSADFRLKDPFAYEEWYGIKHTRAELLEEAVYGLPELYRDRIREARLVANPGCYPTASILALLPLMEARLVDTSHIYIDAKSGISGAGRGPALPYHFPEAHEGIEAYKVGSHRHTPEIEQELSGLAEERIRVCFVPHLIPVTRGILCTVYAPLYKSMELKEMHRMFRDFYRDEPFVRVLDMGVQPNIKNVKGSNFCDIGIGMCGDRGTVIVTSVIDNLVKGASGIAVQNMNIMMGLDETTNLKGPGLFP